MYCTLFNKIFYTFNNIKSFLLNLIQNLLQFRYKMKSMLRIFVFATFIQKNNEQPNNLLSLKEEFFLYQFKISRKLFLYSMVICKNGYVAIYIWRFFQCIESIYFYCCCYCCGLLLYLLNVCCLPARLTVRYAQWNIYKTK